MYGPKQRICPPPDKNSVPHSLKMWRTLSLLGRCAQVASLVPMLKGPLLPSFQSRRTPVHPNFPRGLTLTKPRSWPLAQSEPQAVGAQRQPQIIGSLLRANRVVSGRQEDLAAVGAGLQVHRWAAISKSVVLASCWTRQRTAPGAGAPARADLAVLGLPVKGEPTCRRRIAVAVLVTSWPRGCQEGSRV